MERVSMGRTGMQVSPLGMGVLPLSRHGHDDAVATIRGVLDLGINWFDTARAYGDMEQWLGDALKGRRGETIVITKTGTVDPAELRTHIDESLTRLTILLSVGDIARFLTSAHSHILILAL